MKWWLREEGKLEWKREEETVRGDGLGGKGGEMIWNEERKGGGVELAERREEEEKEGGGGGEEGNKSGCFLLPCSLVTPFESESQHFLGSLQNTVPT